MRRFANRGSSKDSGCSQNKHGCTGKQRRFQSDGLENLWWKQTLKQFIHKQRPRFFFFFLSFFSLWYMARGLWWVTPTEEPTGQRGASSAQRHMICGTFGERETPTHGGGEGRWCEALKLVQEINTSILFAGFLWCDYFLFFCIKVPPSAPTQQPRRNQRRISEFTGPPRQFLQYSM